MLSYTKKNLTRLPYSLGKVVACIPYSYRLGIGSIYNQRKKEIKLVNNLNYYEKQCFVFEKVKKIAEYAYLNVPFYKKLYRDAEVNPFRLKCFNDLKRLPVIDKNMLQSISLEERSFNIKGRYIVNTGGSSGQPLNLYIQPSSIPHEWGHMHEIWDKVGFRQNNLRIVFAGRSDVREIVEYDSARHQLSVDIYKGWDEIAGKLLEIYDKYKPTYLHGYPSSIFDFILWLNVTSHPLLSVLKKNIQGMLLGSELPSPILRKRAENILECKSVSWYGHTERAILAYEKRNAGIYYPFHSYGYTEACEDENGFRLIGTSYYNYASPLIRYDTGDLISPSQSEGFLESFTVQNGREGEYILDVNGDKIFLTALIFGRHHQLFDKCRHLQIYQHELGKAVVLVVPIPGDKLTDKEMRRLFDTTNVLIDFSFTLVDKPLKTPAGKIPLLIRK